MTGVGPAPEPRPVLVVGAGPVGMTAALALRARGLPVTVLEADPLHRVRPGSRALFVHRESLDALERMSPGLGTRIGRYGVVWRTRRTLYRGRQVYAHTFPPATSPPFTSLRQVDTEGFLFEACKLAGVEFRWGQQVSGVSVEPDAVEVSTTDGARWRSRYVVAADGARSAVRRALDIPMRGTRSAGYHVVVDVAEPGASESTVAAGAAAERVFHYEHPGVGGRTVLRVPFTGGFQIDLQCHPEDPPQEWGTPGAARRWLPAIVGDGYDDRVLWVSSYHFLQVVAESLADPGRRVLLAGEAAHLFPPFGARGLNSGIADAEAAADAIADALAHPDRAAGAVERFASGRWAAARFNCTAAGTALAHLRPSGPMRLRQRVAATCAPVVPRFGRWLERAPYGPHHGSPADPTRRY